MELVQLKQRINDLRARITKIRDCLDVAAKQQQFDQLAQQMSKPGFWDNQDSAKSVVSRLSALKAVIEPAIDAEKKITDMAELFEVALAENNSQIISDTEQELGQLEKKCAQIELTGMLSGPDDMKNCFFSIHAGAGGTESCDWVSMLLRMYTRFFQQNKFTYEELDMTPGEEAGIRSITLKVAGPFAFGKLSCESGVHRLVRISPFDANKRRHTSFAAVDVMPEYDDDIDIEIDEKDLRIDFYRAGGAGGQHVNKTSSAVRITHAPSGIVTQCQSDRSQHRNKAEAMKMLKAKLYMLEQQKRDAEVAKLYGSKGEIAWGNQIRSYVLQPYQMVKDHRTDCQTGKVDAVLDGDIEDFIDSYLQYRAEKKHKHHD
ncbi:MAG: peptide chain release factor 2 [Planctomycetes bacterium]|nr:peptide chain release factor 2 [Planctomycetota bacterium]MBU1518628.1 peptide chain release factor 2 [Planctomycetota bacterium]MBU2458152.1 peptide chain release factor 2 [Planctomycetota bacterium]